GPEAEDEQPVENPAEKPERAAPPALPLVGLGAATFGRRSFALAPLARSPIVIVGNEIAYHARRRASARVGAQLRATTLRRLAGGRRAQGRLDMSRRIGRCGAFPAFASRLTDAITVRKSDVHAEGAPTPVRVEKAAPAQ